MSDFIVRSYEKGDENQLVKLLTTVFGEWPDRDVPTSLGFWRWKYESSISGKNLIAVVLDGDKIIGCNHGYTQNVKVGKSIYLCAVASDLAVSRDFRRMGVSKLLSDQKGILEKEADVDLSYWVTENPIIIKNNREKKTNPVFPHKITEYTWINDIEKHLEASEVEYKNIKNIGYKLIKKIQSIKQGVDPQKNNSRRVEIENIERFDHDIDDLWISEGVNYQFSIERKQDYLNWRYCDPRAGKYDIQLASAGTIPVGYIINRINRYNPSYPTGYIVDIFSKQDPMIQELLIHKSISFFNENDVNVVRYRGVEGSLTLEILMRYGFIDLGRVAPEVILSSKNVQEDWKRFMVARKEELLFHIGDTEFM